MPRGKTKKADSDELKQLKAIRSELKAIRKELDKSLHKSFWKRAAVSFGTGITKGVGLIIGTTIIAAIVIFLLQTLISKTGFGDSLEGWIQGQLQTVEVVD